MRKTLRTHCRGPQSAGPLPRKPAKLIAFGNSCSPSLVIWDLSAADEIAGDTEGAAAVAIRAAAVAEGTSVQLRGGGGGRRGHSGRRGRRVGETGTGRRGGHGGAIGASNRRSGSGRS